jgi:Xaa-Pro aminopeptidase
MMVVEIGKGSLMSSRLDTLRAKLTNLSLDAILINQPENRRYLSGFTGSAGVLIVSAGQALLATDFRYYDQVRQQAPGFELAEVGNEFGQQLPELLKRVGAHRVGFESGFVSVAQHTAWVKAATDVEWVPTEDLVEDMRAVKDSAELAAVRAAVNLADQALAAVAGRLQPGLTERQVAWELEAYLRTHGADDVAFDPIVASGPNGALPHLRPTDRRIQAGEPIVIDIGAQLDGYHSDMTRTLYLGQPDDRFREIYNLVLQAQLAAERGLRAGMGGREADALARSVIEAGGYGDQFGHGLGHGVGLAVHEKPRLGKTSEDVLQPDMLVTVEPGIYLPGWGGVRIEDIVRVTPDGAVVLTGAAKDLP